MSLPSRQDSLAILHQYVKNEALRRHCYMVAAALEAYAHTLREDAELWYQTGLLHDLDWEMYPEEHPHKAVNQLLTEYPLPLREAVASHAPERTSKQPVTLLETYLFACDEISGFMHAVALLRPDGFVGMQPKSIKKKLKDKSFAAAVSRQDIEHGLELINKQTDEHLAFLINVFTNLES